jgi:phosphatidylglycerophosphate synthase
MSKPKVRVGLALRTVATLLGLALLIYLIRRVGSETLIQSFSALGWGLLLIVALGGVSQLLKTWAWKLTLAGRNARVSFARMFQLRLACEAVGQVGAFGQLLGEGLRVSALSREMPIDSCVSSVTLDRALFMVTGAVVIIAGMTTALLVAPLTHALRWCAVLFAIALAGLLCMAVLAAVRRWRFLSASASAFSRVRYFGRLIERVLPLIQSVENSLFDFHRRTPFAFWASLLLNLVCHGLAVIEVYFILLLLGVTKVGLSGALVCEALTKLLNIVGLFNPGNIGTYEGGNISIAKMLALPASIGLVVAVVRRARGIFWSAAGIVCFIFVSRQKAWGRSADIVVSTDPKGPHGDMGQSITACIFLDKKSSPLLQVGTLPILLRTIIAIRRGGGGRIIVYAERAIRRKVERELLDTGRLPHYVDWCEPPSGVLLHQLLGRIASESKGNCLLVVDGNSTYHPALFRQACAWTGQNGAMSLTEAGTPIGIHMLSANFVREVTDLCPSDTRPLDKLETWLVSSSQVQCQEVEPESWHRVITAEDRISAERKLDRWLVKPTDGIFARINRKISIPISRQIIRLPITPNLVSLFTLGVGLVAGVFFARGGYWSMLTGAVLSVWASILDGCDGEVARLRLMETDFGCWLETVCDWLYYLFIFGGMAVGLTKTLEPLTVAFWGSWLLLGAVMSFLVTGFGRQRFAKRRPEQYLAIWQAKAESRPSNPILYIGRNTEFIVRRCFLPYALLFFALLNMIKIAFFLSAIGANLVWLIALYSYLSFAATGSKLKGKLQIKHCDSPLKLRQTKCRLE